MIPLVSWWFFDEIRAPVLEIVSLGAVTLLLLGGALVYLCSEKVNRRLTALLAGLLPVWVIIILVPAFYWHGRQVPYLPKPINGYAQILPGLIFASIVTPGKFFPGLYTLLRMKILKQRLS